MIETFTSRYMVCEMPKDYTHSNIYYALHNVDGCEFYPNQLNKIITFLLGIMVGIIIFIKSKKRSSSPLGAGGK